MKENAEESDRALLTALNELVKEVRFLNSDTFAESLSTLRREQKTDFAHLEQLLTLQFTSLNTKVSDFQNELRVETGKREAAAKELWEANDKLKQELSSFKDSMAKEIAAVKSDNSEVRGKLGIIATAIAAGTSLIMGIVLNYFTAGKH